MAPGSVQQGPRVARSAHGGADSPSLVGRTAAGDPFLLNQVQCQLLDLGQQLRLNVGDTVTFLLDFHFARDLRQVPVLPDEAVDFAQRTEAIAGPEDIIRPRGIGDDDVACADRALDGQLVLRVCGADSPEPRSMQQPQHREHELPPNGLAARVLKRLAAPIARKCRPRRVSQAQVATRYMQLQRGVGSQFPHQRASHVPRHARGSTTIAASKHRC